MQTSGQKAVSLFDIVARVESNNRATAARFEPGIFNGRMLASLAGDELVAKIQQINKCSRATAQVIFSTSWGAVQIMGFNLYDRICNYQRDFGTYLADPSAQLLTFNAFCSAKGIFGTPAQFAGDPALRSRFARIYNGDPNYVGLLCDSLRHFGYVIISDQELPQK